jgi:Fic family protein
VQLPGEVAAVISEAEHAIAGLNFAARGHLAPLARLMLRTESIASSKVEGLQVDARSLARAEARSETGGHVGTSALEILASVDAMQLAVERASSETVVSAEDIMAVHAELMKASSPRIAGVLRSEQNWIGGNDYNPCGADFVPPPPDDVQGLLDDLVAFCNEEMLPPLVQAAIAHAQFETIHPFADGNGRTGRALVQVVLRRRDLAPAYVPPISVMLARRKETYIHGLRVFREGHVAEWLRMFAEATASAARLAQRYLGLVSDLQEQWREQLRPLAPRSDAAAWTILDVLPAHPVVTAGILMGATSRTRPAVVNAVAQLVDAGVLIPLSTSARNRSWEASGLLDLIVALEAGE